MSLTARRWLWPVIIVIVLAAAVFWFMRSPSNDGEQAHRRAIHLSGEQTGDFLVLTERFDDEKTSAAEMTLLITGNQLKGKWKGSRQFDLELTAD